MAATKLLPLLSVLSFIALSAAACATAAPKPAEQAGAGQDQPRRGGFITLAGEADPPSFDQQKENTYNTVRPFAPVYNNIVRFAPDDPDKIVADLAEKWDFSQDGKTLTFSLRKGVKFHGSDLTSEDVKFTIDRIRGAITQGPGALASPRKNLVASIERVDTPDPYTAILRMQYPQASLLPYLANNLNPVYSKKWVEAGHEPAKEANGTGPFLFKEYQRGAAIRLERNPNYWNSPLPYADGVNIHIVPDAGTRLAALRTGQLHFLLLRQAQADTVAQQIQSGDLKDKVTLMTARADSGSTGVFINVTKPPFDDLRLRRALTLAVDRSELKKAAGVPDAEVRGWLVPGSFWALPPEELAKMPGYGPDKAAERAEARRLLAEAGYPSGLTVEGLTRTEQPFIDSAIVFADQFAKVGITMKIVPQDISIVYDRFAKKDYQLGPSSAGAGTSQEPDTIYGQFHVCGSERNYNGYCDSKVDELFAKQSRTLDPQERRKLVWDLERTILQAVPNLSTGYSEGRPWGVRTELRGFVPHPSEYNHSRLDTLWLAQ